MLANAKDLWILRRIVNKIAHPNTTIRKDALDFFYALITKISGAEKDLVVKQSVDLIRCVLFTLRNETVPGLIRKELELLELCFYNNANEFLKLHDYFDDDSLVLDREDEINLNTNWL